MMTNVLILGANGAIAKLVTQNLIDKADIHLTLFLRKSNRLADLQSPNVDVVEGDINDQQSLDQVMPDQDIVFVATGATSDVNLTKTIFESMIENDVSRIISINDLGIYHEVPGKFGQWNQDMIGNNLKIGREAADFLEKSGLDYTTLRLAWLSDSPTVDYELTQKGQNFKGTTVSRASVADFITKIIFDPSIGSKQSIGLDQAGSFGDRPVYF